MNLPNLITLIRMVLAIPFFVLATRQSTAALDAAWVLFLVIAFSDGLDGWLARRYGWITKTGRVLDPLSDKILICGAFILLIDPEIGLYPWMVAVIVLRELIVNILRAFTEGEGKSSAANFTGKAKMFCECASVVAILIVRAHHMGKPGWHLTVDLFLWITILVVVVSGLYSLWNAWPGLKAGLKADSEPAA